MASASLSTSAGRNGGGGGGGYAAFANSDSPPPPPPPPPRIRQRAASSSNTAAGAGAALERAREQAKQRNVRAIRQADPHIRDFSSPSSSSSSAFATAATATNAPFFHPAPDVRAQPTLDSFFFEQDESHGVDSGGGFSGLRGRGRSGSRRRSSNPDLEEHLTSTSTDRADLNPASSSSSSSAFGNGPRTRSRRRDSNDEDHGFCQDTPCFRCVLSLARFPCSAKWMAVLVRRPCSALAACLFLPLLFSVLALSHLKLSFDVGLSSFSVSHTHPVAMHYDAYWNANRDWSDARSAAEAKRKQQEEQDKQKGGDGGGRLLHELSFLGQRPYTFSSSGGSSSNDNNNSHAGRPTQPLMAGASVDAVSSTFLDAVGRRRLSASSKWIHDRMELVFYHPTQPGGNVLTPPALDAMRQVERLIADIPNYAAFCWKFTSGDCVPPNSLTTYFFPTRSDSGALRFDGAGEPTPYFEFTLAEILNQPSAYFFFSDDVDPPKKQATFTKTVFVFNRAIGTCSSLVRRCCGCGRSLLPAASSSFRLWLLCEMSVSLRHRADLYPFF
jgi:hypothetical protein